MLFRVAALLILLCAVYSFAQSPVAKKQTNQSEADQNGGNVDFWFIPSSNPLPEQEAHDWYQWFWPPNWANWALVIVAAWAAKIALRTLGAIEDQVKANQESAKAALRQANAARHQTRVSVHAARLSEKALLLTERADILVYEMKIAPGPPEVKVSGDSTMRIVFKNFGRTRANKLRTTSFISVGTVNPDLSPDGSIATLGASDTIQLNFKRLGTGLTAAQIDDINNGALPLVCNFSVQFEDVFERTHSMEGKATMDRRDGHFLIEYVKTNEGQARNLRSTQI
jgi:hypothetical protein